MTQPQATTPVPEKPAVRGTGRLIPGPEFLSRAREGGIIYPFLVLFVVEVVIESDRCRLPPPTGQETFFSGPCSSSL